MAEKGHPETVGDRTAEIDPPNSTATEFLPETQIVRSPVPRFDLLSDNEDIGGAENQTNTPSAMPTAASQEDVTEMLEDSVTESMSLHLPHSATFDDTHSNESGYPWSRPQSVPDVEFDHYTLNRQNSQVNSDPFELQNSASMQFSDQLHNLEGIVWRPDRQLLTSTKESHIKPTNALKRDNICVFDARTFAIVPGHELTGDFPPDQDQLKVMLSQRYSIPKDCVYILSPSFLVIGKRYVIVVAEELKSKLKLLLSESIMEHVVAQFAPQPQYCACVDGSTTPEILQQMIESSLRNYGDIRFMWNKTVLQNGTLAEYGIQDLDILDIIRVKPMAAKTLYRSSTFSGLYYILDVLNVDSVEDLKRKFLHRFASEFPSVASGLEVLFFTQGTTLLKPGEHPFLGVGTLPQDDSSDSFDPDDKGQLVVHAEPRNAVKATLSFRLDGAKKKQTEAIFVPPTASPAQVRDKVSRFCHKPANSLKILVQGKKIRSHEQISQCPDFRPDCSIVVEFQPQMDIQVLVQFLPGGGQKRLMVSTYKHDTLGSMRKELARALHIDPFHLSLRMQEGQSLEDLKSVRECRLQQGDKIVAVVHEKRAMVHVRKPAQINDVLLVDDTSCTTIQQIAEFIQHRHGLKSGNVYLLCNGRRLRGQDTLEAASVQSGNTLLVCCEEHPLPSNLHFLFEIVDQERINKKIQIVSPSGERFLLQVPEGSDISRVVSAFTAGSPSTDSKPPSVPGVWVLSRDPCSGSVSGGSSAIASLNQSSSNVNVQVTEFPAVSLLSLSYSSMPSPIAKNMSTPMSDVDSPDGRSKSHSNQLPTTSSPASFSVPDAVSRNTLSHTSADAGFQPRQSPNVSLTRSRSYTNSTPSTTANRSRHTSEKQTSSCLVRERVLASEIFTRELIQRDRQQFIKRTNIREQLIDNFNDLSIIDAPRDRELFPGAMVPASRHAEDPGFHHSNTTIDFAELPGVVENQVLVAVGKQLGSEWETFAISLDLQQSTLDHIKTKYANNLHMQAYCALNEWKCCKGREATPAALKVKLLENGLRLIAEIVDNIQELKYLTS